MIISLKIRVDSSFSLPVMSLHLSFGSVLRNEMWGPDGMQREILFLLLLFLGDVIACLVTMRHQSPRMPMVDEGEAEKV